MDNSNKYNWVKIFLKEDSGFLYGFVSPSCLFNFNNDYCKFNFEYYMMLKFMFSKKATKFEEIFTVDLTLCSKCQIDGEDFVNFCGLLRKHELYSSFST